LKPRKKYGNKIGLYYYIKLHLYRIHSACYGELMPEEALTSVTVSDAYR